MHVTILYALVNKGLTTHQFYFRIKNTRRIIIHKNIMAAYVVTLIVQKIPMLFDDLSVENKVYTY